MQSERIKKLNCESGMVWFSKRGLIPILLIDFFEFGESKVQIDPQFVHTFTILVGRFSYRIVEIINRDRKSFYQGFHFCHSIGDL